MEYKVHYDISVQYETMSQKMRAVTSATTLCIVDMQPKFFAANNEMTIRKVIDLINDSKQQEAEIIVLEYDGFGETHKHIQDALLYYGNVAYLTKDEDDGAQVIENYFNNLPKQIALCGVNLDACVLRTANGLMRRGVQVVIKVNACNTDTVQGRNYTLVELVSMYFKDQDQLVVDWE